MHTTPLDSEPVRDDEYIDEPEVGARYRPSVQRRLIERAIKEQVGILHTHEHSHQGIPYLSSVDRVFVQGMLPSLRAVQPDQGHGAVVCSRDAMNAACWTPAGSGLSSDRRIVVVDGPVRVFLARSRP